jgi:hypothetical protein
MTVCHLPQSRRECDNPTRILTVGGKPVKSTRELGAAYSRQVAKASTISKSRWLAIPELSLVSQLIRRPEHKDERSLQGDSIELIARYAVRPDDLVRYIRAEEPTILHFSGHGASEGIFLRIDGAGYRVVSGKALTRLLKDRGVQMVVLNACFSSDLADSLSTAVPTVIGTTRKVGDEAARRFSGAFYRTLGDGHTIGDAFRDGGDSVEVHDLADVYQLVGRSNGRFVGP